MTEPVHLVLQREWVLVFGYPASCNARFNAAASSELPPHFWNDTP